jgi:hypothetical protein
VRARCLFISCVTFSVEGFSSGAGGGGDHLSVDIFDLGHTLDHKGSIVLFVVFLALVAVNGVADKENVLDFGKLGKLAHLVPGADLVVAQIESGQLDARLQTVQLLNGVVREPQFCQGEADFFEGHNSLDVVAAERKNLEVLQLGERNHTLNSVGAQGEAGAGLELVEGLVHLVHGGNLADELDLSGFGGGEAGGDFPLPDGVLAAGRHLNLLLI